MQSGVKKLSIEKEILRTQENNMHKINGGINQQNKYKYFNC